MPWDDDEELESYADKRKREYDEGKEEEDQRRKEERDRGWDDAERDFDLGRGGAYRDGQEDFEYSWEGRQRREEAEEKLKKELELLGDETPTEWSSYSGFTSSITNTPSTSSASSPQRASWTGSTTGAGIIMIVAILLGLRGLFSGDILLLVLAGGLFYLSIKTNSPHR